MFQTLWRNATNRGQRHLKTQKYGFCAYNSPEAALYTSLALKILLRGGTIREAKAIYKSHTTHFRLEFLNRYLDQIDTGRIKGEGVDYALLAEIESRLKDPKWHPERFAHPASGARRASTLARMQKLIQRL